MTGSSLVSLFCEPESLVNTAEVTAWHGLGFDNDARRSSTLYLGLDLYTRDSGSQNKLTSELPVTRRPLEMP